MEDDLHVIRDMANTIYMLSERLSLDHEVRVPIEQLCWIIVDKADALERQRCRAAGQR